MHMQIYQFDYHILSIPEHIETDKSQYDLKTYIPADRSRVSRRAFPSGAEYVWSNTPVRHKWSPGSRHQTDNNVCPPPPRYNSFTFKRGWGNRRDTIWFIVYWCSRQHAQVRLSSIWFWIYTHSDNDLDIGHTLPYCVSLYHQIAFL